VTLVPLLLADVYRKSKYVNLKWLHQELSSRFGKDRQDKPMSVVDKVKAKILLRAGQVGLKGLARYSPLP